MKPKPKARRPAPPRKGARPPELIPFPLDVETLLAEREQLLAQVESLREAHLEVEESQQLYAELFDQAPVGYVNLTQKGRIKNANSAAGRLLGVEPRNLAGMPFNRFVHMGDLALFTQHLIRCGRPGSAEVVTELHLARRGANCIIEMLSQPTTLFGTGDVIYRTVLRDITSRREAEAALWLTQERLRLIVENAREYAILTMDLDRAITSWNPGAEAILGYSEEEVVGQAADLIFTPEDCAADVPEKEARTALREGRAADERWHVRKDGTRFWGSGVMMPMFTGGSSPVGLLKIFRDHTAQMQAQKALEASRDAAEAAARAKDQFLAVLSHELRTPLTPVLIAAQTLARNQALPPAVLEALAMIQRNVRLESQLVDDLLDVTRIGRGKMELMTDRVDVHEAIKRAIEVSSSDIESKEQRLVVKLSAGEHVLSGDARRLRQVFWNLIKNASKFTPPGGRIEVRSRNEVGLLVVEVRDTGIGFEAEAAERIFTAFEQADRLITREFGGLGLGLAISKAIVDAHRGTIKAVSPGPAKGATLSVKLPLESP